MRASGWMGTVFAVVSITSVAMFGACKPEEEICGDGVDNNGDGFVDCNDEGCIDTDACNAHLTWTIDGQPASATTCPPDSVVEIFNEHWEGPIRANCRAGTTKWPSADDVDVSLIRDDTYPFTFDTVSLTGLSLGQSYTVDFQLPVEICDDSDDNDGDLAVDCDDSDCAGDPACAPTSCGDNVIDAGEACDDGNNVDCDGCRADCSAEETGCGDGFICGAEACDDSNTMNGDGCSSTCQNETNPACDVTNCGSADPATCTCNGCPDVGATCGVTADCLCQGCATSELCLGCNNDGTCTPLTESCDCADCTSFCP
ncbi:MAG: hypothetical protein U0271_01450 [Polyangiaceae bacterium]